MMMMTPESIYGNLIDKNWDIDTEGFLSETTVPTEPCISVICLR